MRRPLSNPLTDPTRRDFLKGTVAAAAGTALLTGDAWSQARRGRVVIVRDPADSLANLPAAAWAVQQLRGQLESRDVACEVVSSLEQAPSRAVVVVVAGRRAKWAQALLQAAGVSVPDTPEALGLVRSQAGGRPVLLAAGADTRGLVYAVLELADRVEHARNPIAELKREERIVEQPANAVRSIARLFTSDVEDKAWYYDFNWLCGLTPTTSRTART